MSVIDKQHRLVADRIKTIRKQHGWSQDEMAKLASIDRKTINRIENGHFSPSLDTILRVCLVCELSASELLAV
jgi:DNA-binding XRE family transcriptional regulator